MAGFLVEAYVARTDGAAFELAAERSRLAARALRREGTRVRCVRSIFVPEDETCFLLVEADTVETVHEAATRAAVPFERVLATAVRTNDRPPDPA